MDSPLRRHGRGKEIMALEGIFKNRPIYSGWNREHLTPILLCNLVSQKCDGKVSLPFSRYYIIRYFALLEQKLTCSFLTVRIVNRGIQRSCCDFLTVILFYICLCYIYGNRGSG